MKKRELGKHERKLSRRQFLKLGTYTTAGVVAGVGTGYGINKGLDLLYGGIGYVGQRLVNLDERVDKMEGALGKGARTVKNVEEGRAGFWRRLLGIKEDDVKAGREEYGIETEQDRQEFAAGRERGKYGRTHISLARAGTIGGAVGVGYGLLKKPVSKQVKDIARLKDQVDEVEARSKNYKGEIAQLKANSGNPEYIKQVQGEVNALRRQVEDLHRQYDGQVAAYRHILEQVQQEPKGVKGQMSFDFAKEGGLELRVKRRPRYEDVVLFFGFVFLFMALLSFSFRSLLGFVILENFASVNSLSALFFILSLVLFLFWFKAKASFK